MLVEAALAIMAMGEGGDLIHKSITENGDYDPADEDPPVDGYDFVSVSVETYEDELAQALADLAAARGQIGELEEKIADYDECCDEAVTLIKLWFPDWPYPPVPTPDPLPPPTPQEIEEGINGAVETHEGYTFPSDTAYTDITAIVGDASVEDVTLGITLVWKYTRYDSYGPNAIEWGYIQGGEYHYITSTSNTDPTAILTNKYIKVTDPTTGEIEIAWDYTYAGSTYTWHQKTYPTVSAIIGFGASGHEFKAKNV